MDDLKELLEKSDDPRVRDALNRAFATGVEIGAMITQQAVADGSFAVKSGSTMGQALVQSGITKALTQNAD